MKYVTVIIVAAVVVFIANAFLGSNSASIVGTWRGQDPEDGIMTFHKDGTFEAMDANGTVQELDGAFFTYDIIDEVEPHQLYLTLISTHDEINERFPVGIYKIENDRLIMRQVITYDRYIGGISVGTSRYEIPEDFSGELDIFERI